MVGLKKIISVDIYDKLCMCMHILSIHTYITCYLELLTYFDVYKNVYIVLQCSKMSNEISRHYRLVSPM